jgi:geranylgeranyl diphosphate synthase type II
MEFVKKHQQLFLDYLAKNSQPEAPKNLYQPIDYILNLGGKRLRPVLVLLATEAFGADAKKALPAAMAIETFHNFSLIHDDIMDDAPLRRGKATVHEKWDINTGILSGDAMLIQAYLQFEKYEGELFKPLLQLFSKTAQEVCEGQQYDVDFEIRDNVSIAEYLHMIEYKTAVLVAAALQMGSMIAGADAKNQKLIYQFGLDLGIAFQLQDDYLDAFGNPETFGKKVGGDIAENKKTFLYLKALELASEQKAQQLKHLYSIQTKDDAPKIKNAKHIFEESGAAEASIAAIEEYTSSAFQNLNELDISSHYKEAFTSFGNWLMNRKY